MENYTSSHTAAVTGDFNTWNTDFLTVDLGCVQVNDQNTNGNRILDKFFIIRPDLHNFCTVFFSSICTKGKAPLFYEHKNDDQLIC